MSAPSSSASSMERSTFSHGSVPHTRWVMSRVGAWTDSTGTPCSSASAPQRPGLAGHGSVHTMTSTPSYPSRAATSKAVAQFSG